MHRSAYVALCLLVFLIARAGVSYAQSIKVTPADPSVVVAGKVQFAAQGSGLPSNAVTWALATKGGTICSSGLYTAPTLRPAQNPVQGRATRAANNQVIWSA